MACEHTAALSGPSGMKKSTEVGREGRENMGEVGGRRGFDENMHAWNSQFLTYKVHPVSTFSAFVILLIWLKAKALMQTKACVQTNLNF